MSLQNLDPEGQVRQPPSGSQLKQVSALFERYRTGKRIPATGIACVRKIGAGEEISPERWLPCKKVDFEYWRKECFHNLCMAIVNFPDVIDQIIQGYEDLLSSGSQTQRPRRKNKLGLWFIVSNAASRGHKNYPAGKIPYVSSSDVRNSIVTLVDPALEEIYETPCITVTAFGQATIQPWRFVARGNGGSLIRILKPRFGLKLSELVWFVGQINSQKWRFHYGRMATTDRLSILEVDPPPRDLPNISGIEKRLRTFRKNLNQLLENL